MSTIDGKQHMKLVSINRMWYEEIMLITWTNKWGFIVVDRMARPMLHGHTEKNLRIRFFDVSKYESVSGWKVSETKDGDVVFFTPNPKPCKKIFSAKKIQDAIDNGKGTVSVEDKLEDIKETFDPICETDIKKLDSFTFDPICETVIKEKIGFDNNDLEIIKKKTICMCIIEKEDCIEIMRGHGYGLYTLWRSTKKQ